MIQPGRAGELRTTLDTTTLSGPIGKGITITTNDPHMARVRVVIRAVVLGSVELMPGNKAILSNRSELTRAQSFLIRKEPTETGELRVGGIDTSVPWIDVDAERVESRREAADGLPVAFRGDWILRATLKGTPPVGMTQEWIRFETGLTREPEVTIAIAGDVRPPVQLNAPELSMVAGETKVVLATLRRDLDHPQPVELNAPDGLSARIEPGRGRFFKIVLEWSGEPPAAPVDLKMAVAGESQTVPVTVSAPD